MLMHDLFAVANLVTVTVVITVVTMVLLNSTLPCYSVVHIILFLNGRSSKLLGM